MHALHPLGTVGRFRRFLDEGVWRIDETTRPWHQRAALRLVRFCWSVGKGFEIHAGSLHASALSYYTLLAIVPILALALALARVFGGEEIARREIDKQIVEWVGDNRVAAPAAQGQGTETRGGEIRTNTASDAVTGDHDQTARGGEFALRVVAMENRLFDQVDRLGLRTLGGIGLIGLLWMVIAMLGRVEMSFNAVWGVTQGRSIWRSCTDYLTVVMIVPILAIAASTVPVMDLVVQRAAVAGVSAGSIQTVVGSVMIKKAIVLLFATLAFACQLGFMPNTHVRIRPALAGGFFTAVLFTAWLRLCTLMQIGIAKYSLLYGSLAIVPILLAWVYVSWEIMLLGAEVTCTLQYGAVCPTDSRRRQASPRSRLVLALTLCAEAARTMREQGAPFDAGAFIVVRRLPARLSRAMLVDLVAAGLLAEVAGQPGFYLLCRDPATFTVADVARYVFDDGFSSAELGLHRLDAHALALADNVERELGRVLGRPVDAEPKTPDEVRPQTGKTRG